MGPVTALEHIRVLLSLEEVLLIENECRWRESAGASFEPPAKPKRAHFISSAFKSKQNDSCRSLRPLEIPILAFLVAFWRAESMLPPSLLTLSWTRLEGLFLMTKLWRSLAVFLLPGLVFLVHAVFGVVVVHHVVEISRISHRALIMLLLYYFRHSLPTS